MKPTAAIIALLFVGSLMNSTPGVTHHSNAVVDKDRLFTVTGEVMEWAFVSPHVALYWKGENQNGELVKWYASGGSPRQYRGLALNNKTFQKGERVLVQGHPLRDGRPMMQFQALYKCDGENIPLDPGNLGEYRTRVKIVPLDVERVKALCAEGKLIEGAFD